VHLGNKDHSTGFQFSKGWGLGVERGRSNSRHPDGWLGLRKSCYSNAGSERTSCWDR
jgi:hypothetical protein